MAHPAEQVLHQSQSRSDSGAHLASRFAVAAATTAATLATLFALLFVDAMRHPIAAFDLDLAIWLQGVDQPLINDALNAVRTLTGSEGAVLGWMIAGLVFVLRRWWAPAVALALMPLGGVINEGIGILFVTRDRPHHELLFRVSLNPEERSFPSGHVTGAVLLYGLIFFVAGRIRWAPLRWAVRVVAVVIPLVTGYQRVWGGAHWPSDVLAAYALGGVLLIGLIALARWLEPELAGRSLTGAVGRVFTLSLALAGWLIGRRHSLREA
ncbi:MAG TPA: phosphatase PAP2 family protein [Thermomicrobiales bacterium]|jgi:undecaprenyl-diphosphatase|nr:phosphatase PAP2 family protein [Thermomicrobiales bacterium]